MIGRTARSLGVGGMAVVLLAASAPAFAQGSNDEARLQKLEAQVNALQRRVFPGGEGRYFEPLISSDPAKTGTAIETSTSAITDILARLDALEAQLQRLTASSEENSHALRQLSTRVDALEGGPVIKPALGQALGDSSEAAEGEAAAAGETKQVVEPSPERLAAVQAIAKPKTDDPGDDEYVYGFRLWDAGFYPEAEQQLTSFVDQYPNHWRTTYGRNLLGRAYLDDGKPREAAPWFLKNYQADKTARRSGDSLLYLAKAMIALKDEKRACIALAEFGETYPALAAGRLQDLYQGTRSEVSCN